MKPPPSTQIERGWTTRGLRLAVQTACCAVGLTIVAGALGASLPLPGWAKSVLDVLFVAASVAFALGGLAAAVCLCALPCGHLPPGPVWACVEACLRINAAVPAALGVWLLRAPAVGAVWPARIPDAVLLFALGVQLIAALGALGWAVAMLRRRGPRQPETGDFVWGALAAFLVLGAVAAVWRDLRAHDVSSLLIAWPIGALAAAVAAGPSHGPASSPPPSAPAPPPAPPASHTD